MPFKNCKICFLYCLKTWSPHEPITACIVCTYGTLFKKMGGGESHWLRYELCIRLAVTVIVLGEKIIKCLIVYIIMKIIDRTSVMIRHNLIIHGPHESFCRVCVCDFLHLYMAFSRNRSPLTAPVLLSSSTPLPCSQCFRWLLTWGSHIHQAFLIHHIRLVCFLVPEIFLKSNVFYNNLKYPAPILPSSRSRWPSQKTYPSPLSQNVTSTTRPLLPSVLCTVSRHKPHICPSSTLTLPALFQAPTTTTTNSTTLR